MKIQEKNGRLTISDFDEFDAARIACKIEKDGMWFYEKLKNSMTDADIRKSVDFLISEEKKHLGFFEDTLEALRRQKEDVHEDDDLLSGMDFGVFEPYQSIAELENIVSTPAKALRLGIAIEDKSIQFYEACRGLVSGADTKAALAGIIVEEKRHKALLQKMLR
jgi:rubrerythrin